MNTKGQKKRQKKRHATCVFSLYSLGADIVIEKTPSSSSHFLHRSRSLPTTTTRTLATLKRERERERDPVVATLKRKREKGLLLLENFNGAHKKKTCFDDRLFVSNFTKALSVASNARLRRKGVDKRSRFTAPPTVPTVLDDESAASLRGAFFCRDVK